MVKKTFIIAEAGVNHNGNIRLAKKMIDIAADAGADAVKFQTFKTENLVGRKAAKAEYQKKNTDSAESQFEMIKRLELNDEAHKLLIEYCDLKSIKFLSAPFDLDSIDLLDSLGLDTYKIPSGELTNLPYLRKISRTKKRIILSSGMADLGEIEDAMGILTDGKITLQDITILHCNTEYPTPMEDVNLNAMLTIGAAFPGIQIGYSDHTQGIEISVAAVALGASVIEKHFTIDKNMEGPDHKASLEPEALKQMVLAIRNVETALGNGIKKPSPSEIRNIDIARKYIVARKTIKSGELFTQNNLTTKRSSLKGLSPMRWDEIIGSVAHNDYGIDEVI